MARRSPLLLASLAALALAGCGPDPCGAARQWATTCGLPNADEAEFRTSCEAAMAACTGDEQAQAARYYQCLANGKVCSTLSSQACAQDVSANALRCVQSFK